MEGVVHEGARTTTRVTAVEKHTIRYWDKTGLMARCIIFLHHLLKMIPSFPILTPVILVKIRGRGQRSHFQFISALTFPKIADAGEPFPDQIN